MMTQRWVAVLETTLCLLSGGVAFAQGRGQVRGQDKNNGRVAASVEIVFTSEEREIMRAWHHDHENNLPPGLAKRDRLPAGLERQLRERGTLPPGLQKKIFPLPVDLERRLSPLPSGWSRVIIGGSIVLMNSATSYVQAIFRF